MGMGGKRPAPAVLPPARNPAILAQEARWDPGPIWAGTKNLAPNSFRSTDRTAPFFQGSRARGGPSSHWFLRFRDHTYIHHSW
jgi:hypothetical protein